MDFLSYQALSMLLLLWAIVSVCWLGIVTDDKNLLKQQVATHLAVRKENRSRLLKKDERIDELVQSLKDKDTLISHLSFELDRIYMAEIAAVPPANASNTDKVLAYYSS